MEGDRLQKALRAVVLASAPALDYMAFYRGRMIRQQLDDATGRMTVDVIMDDKRMPDMASIPLKTAIPASRYSFDPPSGAVMVGFENGSPEFAYATPAWDGGEPDLQKLVFGALQLFLGGELGAEPTLKGTTYRTAEGVLNKSVSTLATTAAAACTGPLVGLAPFFTGLAAALGAFEGAAPTYLSTRARVL